MRSAFAIILLFIIYCLVILDSDSQDRKFIRGIKAVVPPVEGDSIERDGTIDDIWFNDISEAVRLTDTSHWSRTDVNNLVNNAGAADTIKLFAFKNDHPSFLTMLINATGDTVDSMEVYVDSLTKQGGGYTIQNDSGRDYNTTHWYVGKPIEHWVMQYVGVGRHGPTGDTTGFYDGRYWAGQGGAQPQPDSMFKGLMPAWCIPSEADSGVFDNGNGGYPFRVGPGEVQTIGTDIYISKNAIAGDYYGRLRVLEGGKLTHSFPLHLFIYDYTLPDSIPFKSMVYVDYSLPTYVAGHANGSAAMWAYLDKTALMLKRHLMGMNYQSQTPENWAANNGKWYVPNNTFFGAANGYEGVGQDKPFNWFMIGIYDMPANVSDSAASLCDTCWATRTGWPTTPNQGGWENNAEKWADTVQSITGEPLQTTVTTYFYGADEMDVNRAAYNWMFRRTNWTLTNGGDAENLPWFFTMAYFDGYGGSERSTATETDIYEWSITLLADTFGYNMQYLNVGSYLTDAYVDTGLGHKYGYYNGIGPRAAFPGWTQLDARKTEIRAAFWIAWKYGLHHLWNWHGWYMAEWELGQGTSHASPMDTSIHVFWPEAGKTHGIQDHTILWTMQDTVRPEDDRGINAPIVGITVKNWRQAQLDYMYLWVANDLGVNTQTVYDSIVGRALSDWGADPNWPESYTWDYNFQPHWREEGYYYERYRRALADSIIANK
jgi:hypothetical protein